METNFFHGTTRKVQQLSIAHADDQAPFGPAIYLSDDPKVAACYAKRTGEVLTVALNGDMVKTIDFDTSIDEQTLFVQQVVRSIYHQAKIEPPAKAKDARDYLWPLKDSLGSKELNSRLSRSGIWMVRGHLDGYEHSGRLDDGVQYAVLNDRHVTIIDRISVVPKASRDFSF